MITVKIVHNNNDIYKVECKGHSGFDKSGKDIVCSAVSAVIQTALMGLMDVSKSKVLYDREDGYLKFTCPDPESRDEGIRQQAILKTMKIGLKDLQSGYKAFIKMEEI